MSTKLLLPIIPILLVSIVTATAGSKSFSGEMVMEGSWHGDEVAAKDGESWLALVEEQGVFSLQETTLSVTFVEDAVLDTPPAKTGKKISWPQGLETVVLLRNIPQLKAGPVVSAEIIDRDFSAGKATAIYFKGMLFELAIKCDASIRGEETADCPLTLSDAHRSQAIASYPVHAPGTDKQSLVSEAFPRLFWAGDLDGDDRLDLILDLTDHYNVSAPTLLLSGEAGEGTMVQPVAEFRTTGC